MVIFMAEHYLHIFFFFSSRRRHTRYWRDWSSDVCSSDLEAVDRGGDLAAELVGAVGHRGLGERVGEVARLLRRRLLGGDRRSEERRVGKEGRSRWSPYH